MVQGIFFGLNFSLLDFINGKKLFKKDKDSRIYDEFPFYISQTLFILPIYSLFLFLIILLYYVILPINRQPNFIHNIFLNYFFL